MPDDTPPLEPRLHFANTEGKYIKEFIPGDDYAIEDWFRNKHINFRNYFGQDIYYWHIRHNYHPIDRKTKDLEFILHVIEEHDHEPEDRIERRHFKRAWGMYGHELTYVMAELAKETSQQTDGKKQFVHPYARAYTHQWYELFPEVETKLLYHGIRYSDYFELLDLLDVRLLQRRRDFAKAQGLDPGTLEKLASVKEPMKPKHKATKHNKPSSE